MKTQNKIQWALIVGTTVFFVISVMSSFGDNEQRPQARPGGENEDMPPMMERQPGHRDGPEQFSQSQARRGQPPRGMDQPQSMVSPDQLKAAGVPEAMIAEFSAVIYESELAGIDLMATVEKQELMLKRLMEAEVIDEKKIETVVDALNQARGALFKQTIQQQLRVRKILGRDVLERLHPFDHHQMQGRPQPGR